MLFNVNYPFLGTPIPFQSCDRLVYALLTAVAARVGGS